MAQRRRSTSPPAASARASSRLRYDDVARCCASRTTSRFTPERRGALRVRLRRTRPGATVPRHPRATRTGSRARARPAPIPTPSRRRQPRRNDSCCSSAPGMQTIEGVTVFPDHADPEQFWYLPAPVSLRGAAPRRRRSFTFIKFKPAAAAGGVEGGGFLDVRRSTLTLTEDRARDPVASWPGRRPADRGALRRGHRRCVALNLQGAGRHRAPAAAATAPASSRSSRSSARPPVALRRQRRGVQPDADQEGATILEQAFAQGAAPIGVIYDLKFTALQPALDVEITADFERIYTTSARGLDAHVYFVQVGDRRGLREARPERRDPDQGDRLLGRRRQGSRRSGRSTSSSTTCCTEWFEPSLRPGQLAGATRRPATPTGTAGTAGTGTAPRPVGTTPGTPGTASPGTPGALRPCGSRHRTRPWAAPPPTAGQPGPGPAAAPRPVATAPGDREDRPAGPGSGPRRRAGRRTRGPGAGPGAGPAAGRAQDPAPGRGPARARRAPSRASRRRPTRARRQTRGGTPRPARPPGPPRPPRRAGRRSPAALRPARGRRVPAPPPQPRPAGPGAAAGAGAAPRRATPTPGTAAPSRPAPPAGPAPAAASGGANADGLVPPDALHPTRRSARRSRSSTTRLGGDEADLRAAVSCSGCWPRTSPAATTSSRSSSTTRSSETFAVRRRRSRSRHAQALGLRSGDGRARRTATRPADAEGHRHADLVFTPADRGRRADVGGARSNRTPTTWTTRAGSSSSSTLTSDWQGEPLELLRSRRPSATPIRALLARPRTQHLGFVDGRRVREPRRLGGAVASTDVQLAHERAERLEGRPACSR